MGMTGEFFFFFFGIHLTSEVGEFSVFFSGLLVSLIFSSHICFYKYRELSNCFISLDSSDSLGRKGAG